MKFDNLPNDIPFKGNVEMIVDGIRYAKKPTSTFFPKNWDIIRVKEEIALAYDKMKASGITYNPRSTNRKYDTINSEGTFEIRIEFDELGNLTNAYPLINFKK
ncbi:EndoU domain-containing protein [Pontimicrobium sp. MEBiC01747]